MTDNYDDIADSLSVAVDAATTRWFDTGPKLTMNGEPHKVVFADGWYERTFEWDSIRDMMKVFEGIRPSKWYDYRERIVAMMGEDNGEVTDRMTDMIVESEAKLLGMRDVDWFKEYTKDRYINTYRYVIGHRPQMKIHEPKHFGSYDFTPCGSPPRFATFHGARFERLDGFWMGLGRRYRTMYGAQMAARGRR